MDKRKINAYIRTIYGLRESQIRSIKRQAERAKTEKDIHLTKGGVRLNLEEYRDLSDLLRTAKIEEAKKFKTERSLGKNKVISRQEVKELRRLERAANAHVEAYRQRATALGVKAKAKASTTDTQYKLGEAKKLLYAPKHLKITKDTTREVFEAHKQYVREIYDVDVGKSMRIPERIKQFRKNYMEGLVKRHGAVGELLSIGVNMLDLYEFAKLYYENALPELNYVYYTNTSKEFLDEFDFIIDKLDKEQRASFARAYAATPTIAELEEVSEEEADELGW